MTVAHEIKYPWRGRKSSMFPKGYRETFITVWHVDPETDGTDDSCGWYQRSRHGDASTLSEIIKRYEQDWDRVFEYRDEDSFGKPIGPIKSSHFRGYFLPNGDPHMSTSGIVLNLVFIAAGEHFKSYGDSNWEKARKFCQNNLADILLLAENPTDSFHDSIVQTFGAEKNRTQRIESMAAMVYGWVLRRTRPWYRHPRWHFWHWKIQCHPLQSLKRSLFTRCQKCGGRIHWGESVISNSWHTTGPLWFRSEKNVECNRCHPCVVAETKQKAA